MALTNETEMSGSVAEQHESVGPQPSRVKDQVVGLPRIHVEISDSPNSMELERTREMIFHRVRDSQRGVVVDCSSVGGTTLDALFVLRVAQQYAFSEKKRFLLYGVNPDFRVLLNAHQALFSFEVFGEKVKKEAKSKPRKKKSYWSTPKGRRTLRIGIPILVGLPIVAAAEYAYLMNDSHTDTIVVSKNFELGSAFRVNGVVHSRVGAMPVTGAEVFVSQRDAVSGEAKPCWMSRTDGNGDFQIDLPINQNVVSSEIDVTIVSGGSAFRSSHTIRNGVPLAVRCRLDR